jgi:hypothetical protein
MSTYKWYNISDQIGCICKGKRPGRRLVTEAQVDTIHAAFFRSPRKSTRHAARQLNMPHTTVHKIMRKRLKFKSHKYQLLQHVTAWGKKKIRFTFRFDFLSRLDLTFLQPKLSFMMKPHYIYRKMLIDITWESGEATILMKLLTIRETVQSWTCFVLCPNEMCSGLFSLPNVLWLT